MKTKGKSISHRLRTLLALVLSMLYLFGPLRHEVGETLHHISHWMESLHHHSGTDFTNDSLHPHSYSSHRFHQEIHTHEGIVWVDHFLRDAPYPSDQEKIPGEEPGPDKHLFSGESFLIFPTAEGSHKAPDIIAPAGIAYSSSCFRPPRT